MKQANDNRVKNLCGALVLMAASGCLGIRLEVPTKLPASDASNSCDMVSFVYLKNQYQSCRQWLQRAKQILNSGEYQNVIDKDPKNNQAMSEERQLLEKARVWLETEKQNLEHEAVQRGEDLADMQKEIDMMVRNWREKQTHLEIILNEERKSGKQLEIEANSLNTRNEDNMKSFMSLKQTFEEIRYQCWNDENKKVKGVEEEIIAESERLPSEGDQEIGRGYTLDSLLYGR